MRLKSNPSSTGQEKFVKVLNTEDFYLPFEVKVQAKNEYGKGPNSSISIVYSSEGSKYHMTHHMTHHMIKGPTVR